MRRPWQHRVFRCDPALTTLIAQVRRQSVFDGSGADNAGITHFNQRRAFRIGEKARRDPNWAQLVRCSIVSSYEAHSISRDGHGGTESQRKSQIRIDRNVSVLTFDLIFLCVSVSLWLTSFSAALLALGSKFVVSPNLNRLQASRLAPQKSFRDARKPLGRVGDIKMIQIIA